MVSQRQIWEGLRRAHRVMRWYNCVPFAMAVMAMATIFLGFVLNALSLRLPEPLIAAAHPAEVMMMWTLGFLVMTAVVWSIWVIPWFRAGDRWALYHLNSKQKRRAATKDILCRPWIVTIVPFGIAVLLFSYGAWILWIEQLHDWPAFIFFALAALVISAVLTGITILYRRSLRRRWQRTLRQRHHCMQCGYDLCHNRFAPCPECGWRRVRARQATP